ncbi:MAG: hypothetical protein MRZ49_06035, partial [Lachnospiraceae bacterium]|nr:hypothetical protein [Lachnospiraceae bacterium]
MVDKDNVFLDGEVQGDNSDKNISNELNDSEVSGKINEFIRYMMDSNMQEIDSERFADMAMYLSECYHNNYRHSYYNISAEIYTHWKEVERDEQNLINLATNVESLRNIIVNKTHKNDNLVKKGIQKFYDHIMLEYVRLLDQQKSLDNLNMIITDFRHDSMKLLKEQDISLSQTVAEFENKFGEAESKTNELKKETQKTKRKVKNIYSQFVSILGIFTAIVIVFFGGTSIFSSALSNIHEAQWQQLGFGIALIGMVLFDIIFMFLYILSKLIEVPIFREDSNERSRVPLRWIQKCPYIFVF